MTAGMNPQAMTAARDAVARQRLATMLEGLLDAIPQMLPADGPKFMRLVDRDVRLGCGTLIRLNASVEVVE